MNRETKAKIAHLRRLEADTYLKRVDCKPLKEAKGFVTSRRLQGTNKGIKELYKWIQNTRLKP